MSKRTPGLPQRPRGFWPTPRPAVVPLIPYLPPRARYGEPCAGAGDLIDHLSELWPGGDLIWATDIQPERSDISRIDALEIPSPVASVHVARVDLWITNPPWPRIGQKGDPALSIILHLMTIAPVWALLPWDFGANDYFRALIGQCSDIVPVGRVKWIPDSRSAGVDNCAWFRLDAQNRHPATVRPRL